jgi:hypothetical protein
MFLFQFFKIDESIPYIAIGEHHWKQTRCSEPISLFVGDNATLYCNTSVTLVCDAGGDPAPRISWFLNGKRIEKSYENFGLLILNNSLVLRNVSVQSGLYMCVASNANGTTNATTIINFIGTFVYVFSKRSDFENRSLFLTGCSTEEKRVG